MNVRALDIVGHFFQMEAKALDLVGCLGSRFEGYRLFLRCVAVVLYLKGASTSFGGQKLAAIMG